MKSHYYLAALAVQLLITVQLAFATALEDYVQAPDANYSYKLANTVTGKGYTGYILDMTSQSWRSKSEVDRTLWQHWLIIIKPDKASSNKALLWINGGSNDNPTPNFVDPVLRSIALNTNTVVADLRMVPNQPLKFSDDDSERSEDAIIAYTFDKYIETDDETWPVLLPMVKSAVRAMDTVERFIFFTSKRKLEIKQFVVSGGSKRGWTTWLTAVVDSRVIAVMPLIIDVLNIDEQMKHHFSAYGFYAPAISDYEDMNVFDRINTPKGQELLKIVDPYEYRSRITMPKYLVNSTGDQFFVPDSAQFYFHDLKGEKYLRYVPNTDHGLGGSDTPFSMLAFYQSVLADSPRPRFAWALKDDRIVVWQISGVPTAVNLWQAAATKARDFRRETIGRAWKSSPLTDQGGGVYIAEVAEPKEGWTAFFVEMIYDSGTDSPYKFTTQVHVV
ncbi:MAG: PhoPQ-activated pathogenicity-related family protein, partial [Planctomycetota bacterium]